MKIGRKLTVAAVALLAVGAIGFTAIHSFAQISQPPAQAPATTTQYSGPAANQNAADAATGTSRGADRQDTPPAATPAITADQARATAEAHLNAGPASKIKLKTENGKLVYSVKIGDSKVKVDAMSGEVLGVENDQDDDVAQLGTPAITADQAKATAEAHLNAGPARKVKLDAENGKLIYKVDIGASEVKVDAMSGEVLGVENDQDDDVAQLGPPAITADQARATAEAHLNAGPASKVKLDAENGKLVYSVDIGTSEVKVDAMSGEVLGVENDQDDDVAQLGTPAITADQARATAEAHLNAGPASKVELDAENGKLVYSVDIGTSEVKVDAMSGEVLGVESDLD